LGTPNFEFLGLLDLRSPLTASGSLKWVRLKLLKCIGYAMVLSGSGKTIPIQPKSIHSWHCVMRRVVTYYMAKSEQVIRICRPLWYCKRAGQKTASEQNAVEVYVMLSRS